MNADRIVLCHVLASRIELCKGKISNTLFARYVLTTFFLLYVLRLLIENDETARHVIEQPTKVVRQAKKRARLAGAIDTLLSEIVTDLNAEIDQLEEDFDYRGRLRDEKWCKKSGTSLLRLTKSS